MSGKIIHEIQINVHVYHRSTTPFNFGSVNHMHEQNATMQHEHPKNTFVKATRTMRLCDMLVFTFLPIVEPKSAEQSISPSQPTTHLHGTTRVVTAWGTKNHEGHAAQQSLVAFEGPLPQSSPPRPRCAKVCTSRRVGSAGEFEASLLRGHTKGKELKTSLYVTRVQHKLRQKPKFQAACSLRGE